MTPPPSAANEMYGLAASAKVKLSEVADMTGNVPSKPGGKMPEIVTESFAEKLFPAAAIVALPEAQYALVTVKLDAPTAAFALVNVLLRAVVSVPELPNVPSRVPFGLYRAT